MTAIAFTTTPPAKGYRAVTYAFDLTDVCEEMMLRREYARLTDKGDSIVAYSYDTRQKPRPVKIGDKLWTKKPGLWAELWREPCDVPS